MAFLIYFFVLLVSAASVLFGLDLMSAPLPKTPNVPIGRSVQVASQPAIQEPDNKKAADQQALTPVYPTTRGAPKAQAETSDTASQQKVQAETSGAASQQDAKLTPAPVEQAAPAVPAVPAVPAATPPAAASTPAPAATVAQNPPATPAAPPPQATAPVAQAPAPAQAPAQATAPVAQAPAPPATVAQNPPAAPAAPTPEATAPVAQAPAQAPVPVAQAPALEQQAKASEPVPTAQPATTEAKLEPAATTQPSATAEKAELAAATRPSQRAASNSCNVQACSAAYQSFRGSDCTYQPYGGERRLCSMTGSAVTARATKPDRPEKSERASRRSGAPDDLREVERVVKRQPSDVHSGSSRAATPSRGEMTEVERIVRHMTRDEADDISVEDGDGRVFIVRKGYR